MLSYIRLFHIPNLTAEIVNLVVHTVFILEWGKWDENHKGIQGGACYLASRVKCRLVSFRQWLSNRLQH